MRVWLNHWFSTAYHFIDSLHACDCYVIATNTREKCVYSENADEFYVEPELGVDEEYLAFCLDFCKKHNIDVFLPRRGLEIISRHKQQFTDLGVKVVCENDADLYKIFNSKVKTAGYFKDLNLARIPDQLLVTSIEEFKQAYKTISDEWGFACIKYDCDEGGQSYKLISPRKANIERLKENNGLCYTYEYVVACLESADNFQPIVVMPYLNGDEISVDCLGVGNKFIAVPRRKVANRVTRLEQDSRLYAICREFWRATDLTCPFNIQFRYHNGELYLLEVNLRLSGGSWKDRYVGVDFIELLFDCKAEFPEVHFEPVELARLESCVEL